MFCRGAEMLNTGAFVLVEKIRQKCKQVLGIFRMICLNTIVKYIRTTSKIKEHETYMQKPIEEKTKTNTLIY